jgi:hypothetical protein
MLNETGLWKLNYLLNMSGIVENDSEAEHNYCSTVETDLILNMAGTVETYPVAET